MKDILFNIIIVAVIIYAAAAKSCNREIVRQNQNMYGTEQVFNQRQLDSAFVADTLDSNLENWLNTTFVDYANVDYRLDGNNVDIDTENAELAKNQIKYYTMIDSISQEFSRLKSVMGK